MPRIVISYRRSDSEAITGRIFDRLVGHYGKKAVFRDIDNIPPGIDFRHHIRDALLQTDVVLAVMGPDWLGGQAGHSQRIDNDSDPVRIELETALRQNIQTIPVLVGNARMPDLGQLPASLKDFTFRNAARVDTGLDFNHHMDRLIRSMDTMLGRKAKLARLPRRYVALCGGIAALAGIVALAFVLIHEYWPPQLPSATPQSAASQGATATANAPQTTQGNPLNIRTLADATVSISSRWRLYDRDTNRAIFQKMFKIGDVWLPAYVRMEDGKLVRWLTLENDQNSNVPIGADRSSSGFAAGDDEAIITSKYSAAGWMVAYDDFSQYNWTRGTIYGVKQMNLHDVEINVNLVLSLVQWVPQDGGYLFESDRPYPIADGVRQFFGRNDELHAQFAGTKDRIDGKLLRTSTTADVAEIKIVPPGSAKKLELADDNDAQLGERIILLGYPSAYPTIAAQSDGHGTSPPNAVYIPDPLVTEGIISKIPTRIAGANVTGDYYQLDISAVFSQIGGPLLNVQGKVIALLSAINGSTLHVAYAVPVSYIRELLQPGVKKSP
jgi:hypothetical protein